MVSPLNPRHNIIRGFRGIVEGKGNMDRLTERMDGGIAVKEDYGEDVLKTIYRCYGTKPMPHYVNCDEGYCVMEKLAEYEDLEEQGKLLKLPCAIGDEVYTNTSMQGRYFRKENRPYKAEVVFIGVNGGDNYMNVDFGNGHMLQFKFFDIGKTVFLTHKEAEEDLEQMK